MTIKELKEIASHAARGTAPANFSKESVNEAFVDGLRELASTYNDFQRNKYDIFDIVIQNADDIMPKRVIDAIGVFAEVQTVAQGQKALFRVKKGRARAKKFLTQVGLSGVYETFRLDTATFELGGHAVGGGATIDFERMLDGAESLAESMQIITEGLTDAVFLEVHKALKAAYAANGVPAANRYSGNGFHADEMVKLMNTVRAYGNGVVIFACPEFVAEMGADAIVPGFTYGTPVSAGMQGVYSPDDIDSIHRTGLVQIFRGAPIVIIPQSFVDESNTTTWIDPEFAYIFPTGGEKVVKVVLEGQTQIREWENRDNSLEVYAYKKMGCAILTYHNWAIYQNLDIADTSYNPYDF